MRYFHKTTQKYHCPTMNIDKLWTLVPSETRQKAAGQDGMAPVVDVTKAGVFKVLGKGALPKQPIIVKAMFFSKSAEKKIKEAGGACVLTA